eukprot:337297-Chlamydomonas_euryale.AAC.2
MWSHSEGSRKANGRMDRSARVDGCRASRQRAGAVSGHNVNGGMESSVRVDGCRASRQRASAVPDTKRACRGFHRTRMHAYLSMEKANTPTKHSEKKGHPLCH